MSSADVAGTAPSGLLRHVLRQLLGTKSNETRASRDDVVFINECGLFDRERYLQRYPDVVEAAMDPVDHYVAYGAAERREPCELFDTGYYLERNPDISSSGINPLRHFCEHGWKEGRAPSREVDIAAYMAAQRANAQGMLPLNTFRLPKDEGIILDGGVTTEKKAARDDYEVITESGTFDPGFYLASYPDVARKGIDPVEHYIKHGARERRNASPFFNTGYYLDNNTDVEKSGLNPLVHFCKYGWKEFRQPSDEFDTAWCWLSQLAMTGIDSNPLAYYTARYESAPFLCKPGPQTPVGDKDAVSRVIDNLLQQEHHDIAYVDRIGQALIRLSRWAEAELVLRLLAGLSRDDAAVHASLADALAKQGKWWQVVEALNTATELDSTQAKLFYRLGDAQERMNNFVLAARAYGNAVALNPAHSSWHYRHGFAAERGGLQNVAQVAYAEAIGRDKRNLVKRCGVGVFHQERGLWDEAAKAYATRLAETPFHAELHYRLGMAHDRCYRWEEAVSSYSNAIALDLMVPYWHYRIGFVFERLERWSEAAEAYEAAATMSEKPVPYWRYRQGWVLAKAGWYEEACLAYIRTSAEQLLDGSVLIPLGGSRAEQPESKPYEAYLRKFSKRRFSESMVSRDATDAAGHYQLGEAWEAEGEWAPASDAYLRALERSNEYRPSWYYRLGFVLFRAGRHREACEAFAETRVLRRAFGVDLAPYQRPGTLRDAVEYNEYFQTLPLKDKTIVYESFHGLSVSCNPLAIFQRILDDPEFSGWKHVWVIKDKNQIPDAYRARDNVVFVIRGSDLYRRYLACASHLINNNTFPTWFVRRPDQRYLNTWHGTPIKSLGKDIRGDFMAHKNAARNLLHATHVLSPNIHTSEVLIDRNDIAGVFQGLLAETGYPRVDKVVDATQADKAALRSALGLAQDVPVILYAPTWRGTLGAVEADLEQLKDDISAIAGLECQVLFRGHHMTEELVASADLPAEIVPAEIDTHDLLSIVDVLITDYSSIWFDFLPTGRPIVYYAYDMEDYVRERGLYFDLREMPGDLCRTRGDLVASLEARLGRMEVDQAAYAQARQRFCPYEDGGATGRAIDFFFRNSLEHLVGRYSDNRRSVMMYSGGFIPNGITASCLNSLQNFDRNKYRLVIAIDPGSVKASQARVEKFNALSPDVQVIARVGGTNWSPEERWVSGMFSKYHELSSPAMREIYRNAYKNEYTRMFGYSNIDCLVQFDGYVNFWSSAFAFGSEQPVDRIIYLHNDMKGELETRFPPLKGTFSLYPEYDKMISVSESVHDSNRAHLSAEYGLEPSKFSYCNNLMDVGRILQNASAELDASIAEWAGSGILFATLGRLSPEKGHKKLITAFHEVVGRYDGMVRLAIGGDGPLKHELQAQIENLGLQDRVRLVGQLPNPYPLLRRSDLFVFSSDYEGQGIAVLEALALKKPVISTDVVGPRTILEGGYGLLVENSVTGLSAGMLKFLGNELKFVEFDAWEYDRGALEMFNAAISKVDRLPEGASVRAIPD